MKRPCYCNRFNSIYNVKTDCRLCWLYHNDNRYKKLWSEPPTMPSVINQAANLMSAIAKRVAGGFKDVKEEVYKERMSICETCPNKTDDWRCTKCGCYLNLKAKWESEKCPENKWPLLVVEKKEGCGCANKQ